MDILAAKVLKAHGLHGVLKVAVFLDRWDDYKHFLTNNRQEPIPIIHSSIFNKKQNYYLVKLEGIHKIEDTLQYIGQQWFINSKDLQPVNDDCFYHYELINLPIKDREGHTIGFVFAIETIGGGDVLIIELNIKKQISLPFDTYTFPVITKEYITISPEGLNLIFKI